MTALGRGFSRLAAVAAIVALVGCVSLGQAAPASAGTLSSGDWSVLDQPALWPSVFDGGTVPGQLTLPLTSGEQGALFDVICGVAGVECLGPIALVSGGTIVIDAVWKSGLGSAFGTWIASLDGIQTSTGTGGNLTGEGLCPVVNPGSWGSGPTYSGTSCTTSGLGSSYGRNGYGIDESPYTQENYYTMTWQFSGSCGFDGGSPGDGLGWIIDPSQMSGGFSSAAAGCMSQAYATLSSLGADSTVVTVPNGQALESGQTCAQDASAEMDGGTYSGSCTYVVKTDTQMLNALGPIQLQPCGNSGQIACPTTGGNKFVTIGGSGVSIACGTTPTPCTQAQQKIATNPPESSSDTQTRVDCYTLGDCTSGGGGGGGVTVTIPQPKAYESYTAYEGDLTHAGITAAPSVVVNAHDEAAYGPKEVTAVVPAPGTQVSPTTVVEVDRNSDTASCPLGDPTCTATSGGGACSVASPSLDMGAFESAVPPNKFPFGLFSWLVAGVGGLPTGSATPSFSLPIFGQKFGTTTMPVSLSMWDSFMVLFREGVLILCTFGFVYWFATSFLGFVDWSPGEQGTLF